MYLQAYGLPRADLRAPGEPHQCKNGQSHSLSSSKLIAWPYSCVSWRVGNWTRHMKECTWKDRNHYEDHLKCYCRVISLTSSGVTARTIPGWPSVRRTFSIFVLLGACADVG